MASGRVIRARRGLAPLGACLLVFVACGTSGTNKDQPTDNLEPSGGTGGATSTGGQPATGGSVPTGGSTEPVGTGGAPTGDAGAAGSAGKVPIAQIGDDVFNEDEVKSYYLTFSDEEYAKLTDLSTLLLSPYTVNEDRYVEAALRVGDTELSTIGVRFKGNYSIWGCVDYATKQRVVRVEPFFGNIDVCQRFSLKLDFDRYVDDVRLDGLKKLNLHAMAADPSKLRERLGYSLYRDMDIVAPRAVHARVYVNGEYQGLFAAVEQIDGRFAANRFGDAGDGNLYRDLWPSADTTTSDAEAALKTNDDPEVMDVSDFMAFRDAINASTEADFAAQMAPYLDFDYLARYIVVDRAIDNFDGIQVFYYGSGWGPNNQNYNWYDVG
ncbi:MAG: CotH kinase family protein, partial [Polyangiaceae bacterium]|nr:CotH kinase family protein [Polyangiaceae bacterium]